MPHGLYMPPFRRHLNPISLKRNSKFISTHLSIKIGYTFYKQSQNALTLDFAYTNWLTNQLRKIKLCKKKLYVVLVTDYLRSIHLQNFSEKETFFRLLQLLSFIRTKKNILLNYNVLFGKKSRYYTVSFDFNEFLDFINIDTKSSYQRNKILKFLKGLTYIKPLTQKFSNEQFRSLLMFPYVESIKVNNQPIIIMYISREIYFYKYPFFYPRSFLSHKSKYDLQIKIEFIVSINKVSRKKQFDVEIFIGEFSVSNKKSRKLKK